MKPISKLNAVVEFRAFVKADAATGKTLAGLVRDVRDEAVKAGHKESAITAFVKADLAKAYGKDYDLFKSRWNAARQALFQARSKSGNNPKAAKFKVSQVLKSAVLATLRENNLTKKLDQRKALLAIAAKLSA